MSQEKWNGLPTALLPALLPPPSPGRDSNSDPHAGIPGHGAWRQEEGFEIAPGLGDGRPVSPVWVLLPPHCGLGQKPQTLIPTTQASAPHPRKRWVLLSRSARTFPSKLCGSRT